MKAMLLTKTAPVEEKCLELVDLPNPKPKDNEVFVKVSVCGVCHTDLDEAEGRLIPTRMPIVPGHQVVGTVNDKGKFVTRFKIGQRIGITWLYWACGQCNFCKSGNENLCSCAKWTGKDANGGYAEYMVIHENFAYPLPEGFTDSQAAPLLCAGVIGYRTFRLADVSDGQIIGLYGFGACAHILIQVIKYKFPNSPVFVFTKTAEHAELAKNLGADWTGRSGDNPPAERKSLLDYCQSDVDALVRLLPAMLPQIDLPRALMRGRYMAAAARMEWAGTPIDTQLLEVLRDNREAIQNRLISITDRE